MSSVYVDARPVLHRNCFVATPKAELEQHIAETQQLVQDSGFNYAERLYKHIRQKALLVDDNNAACQAAKGDTEEWQDFCNDVVILAGMQEALYGTPISYVDIENLQHCSNE